MYEEYVWSGKLVLWVTHTHNSYDYSLLVLTYLTKCILNVLKYILEFTSKGEKNPSLLINCYAFVAINT